MLSGIRRAFGVIKVEENDREIIISGLSSSSFVSDIMKLWNTQRIADYMFSRISSSELRFPKFFAPEVHYMLQQVDSLRNAKSTTRMVRQVIAELEENTWLKRLSIGAADEEGNYPTRIDQSQLANLNAKLFPHQGGFLENYGILTERYGLNGYLLSAEPGTGKAQPLDASIRIPGGWSTMGEMAVGTEVIAKDGTVTKVTGVYPQGEKVIYRVTFEDGRSTECCGEHLWTARRTNGSRQSEGVIDTSDILQQMGKGVDFHIPLISPEDRPDLELAVDPYAMGVMVAKATRDDVSVPEDYFNASPSQRLALLQGILDTKGFLGAGGTVRLSTVRDQLVSDVEKLAWSLGAVVNRTVAVVLGGPGCPGPYHYVLTLRYVNPSQLFRLEGTKERAVLFDGIEHMLKITSIEEVGVKEAQCIQVAHPEHLYVTSDYIVTHNTIMGLAAAECLHSDLTVIVCPKPALDRVWTSTIDWLYKKTPAYWVAASNKPYNGERILVAHFEALGKLISQLHHISFHNAVVILDESHNLNEVKSGRTQAFLEVCKITKSKNVLWSSGTPLKAMGYEMIPLLRSIDPLFTPDVEQRFMKIFGRASDRALDILKNRIGKISYHVSGAAVVDVEKHFVEMKIKIPNGEKFTLDAIRGDMQRFVETQLQHYKANFKTYQKAFDEGIDAYRASPKYDKPELNRYLSAVKEISKGFDTSDPQILEQAKFANQFEAKQIIPSIPNKAIRDAFKNARSVVKYVDLKVVGEALGRVVGKARAQCHVEMVQHVDWKKVADYSEKKVIVFTSYVEVLKVADEQIRKAGFKTLVVHGEVSKNLAATVEQFGKDPSVKFLVATYQTLSTAVPLTMADVTVFVNSTFRSYERDQAEARTARIGQDKGVTYINLFLDTGKEPNISTRSKDILDWSRNQVTAMGIGGAGGETVSQQLNKQYNLGAMESYSEGSLGIDPPAAFMHPEAAMEHLDEGTFTHRGKEYDLAGLLTKLHGAKSAQLPISRLTWVLGHDTPKPDRMDSIRALPSHKVPPIVVEYDPAYGDQSYTVVDGLHRLQRAVDEGQRYISAHVISPSDLGEDGDIAVSA